MRFLALLAGIFLAKPDELDFVHRVFPTVLLMCFLYWQLIPILMASTGSALDLKKLLVYPIPHRQLFTLEVLLRISTGVEMLLLLAGAGIGLLFNPKVPFWAPFTLVFFVAFNLLCSAGVRDLLVRLLARKRVREITTLLVRAGRGTAAIDAAGRVPKAAPARFFRRSFALLALDRDGAPGRRPILMDQRRRWCWRGPRRRISSDDGNSSAGSPSILAKPPPRAPHAAARPAGWTGSTSLPNADPARSAGGADRKRTAIPEPRARASGWCF